MTFARTKIQPPRPRPGGLIERPSLEERLGAALAHQRCVLVSAAAGFGKTTALMRQIQRLPAGTALVWISADEDDDLQRLLLCLIAALEPWDPPWRTSPEALVAKAADDAGHGPAAAELVNALDDCDVAHGVIVLDDLHRVHDAPSFVFLDLLLERLSARWTLVLSTRQDPPLALARLRARGELAEFRATDLQFDTEDVLRLAATLRDEAARPGATTSVVAPGTTTSTATPGTTAPPPPVDAAALCARTQGWPAGIRLALGRAGAVPASGDRAMFDFLASEVIDRLDAELRDFLVRTSVLQELTAVRAAAVSGNPRAAALLDAVERLGLFVTTLEAAEPTLRLHDLFRAALALRLQRDAPALEPELWRRAALGEDDPQRRLGMQLRAGDTDAAAATLLEHTPAMLTGGALAGVAHAVALFPAGYTDRSPSLQRVLGLLSWARWDFRALGDHMARAHDLYVRAGDAVGAHSAGMYGCLALVALGRLEAAAKRLAQPPPDGLPLETQVIAELARLWHGLSAGSTPQIGATVDRLVDLLERSDDAALWYQGHLIPRLNGLPGTASAMARYERGALRLAGDRPLALRAYGHLQMAWRLAWMNGDLDGAAAALAAAERDCTWAGDPPNVRSTLRQFESLLLAMRGQHDAALGVAQTQIDNRLAGHGASASWLHVYLAARIAAIGGNAEALRRHLDWLQRPEAAHGVMPAQLRMLEPLLGHRAWLDGRRADAIAAWTRSLEEEAAIAMFGQAIETRLWLAAAQLESGATADGVATLAPALLAVERDAGVAPLLLARSVVARLLAFADPLPAAQVELLRRWAPTEATTRPAVPGAPSPSRVRRPAHAATLAEPLTDREFEVLERIAAGDSNKVIARAFDLSPFTVKRHVANILDKLGVRSRGQAAAWYRGS